MLLRILPQRFELDTDRQTYILGINLDADDSNSYGKLMKDETDELITQYQNKKSEYQYEPDRAKKEALKSDIEKLIALIFESKLQSQKAEYFTKLKNIERKYADVPNIQQRDEGIIKDTETLNKNHKFDLAQAEKQLKEFTSGQKVKPFFAWKLYFAEVFQRKGGFDVVIANPPAIRIHKQEKDSDHKELMKRIFVSAYKDYDIYVLFMEKGLSLLKPNGMLAFITPDKYLVREYGEKIRGLLLEYSIIELFDISRAEDAFNAAVYPLISLIQKNQSYDEIRVKFAKTIKNLTCPPKTIPDMIL